MNGGGKVVFGVGAAALLWLFYSQMKQAQAAPPGTAPYPLTPSVLYYNAADLQSLNL